MTMSFWDKAAMKSALSDYDIEESPDGTITLKPKRKGLTSDSKSFRQGRFIMDSKDSASYEQGQKDISSYEEGRQAILNYESPLDRAIRESTHRTAYAWQGDSKDIPELPLKGVSSEQLLADSEKRYIDNLANAWKTN